MNEPKNNNRKLPRWANIQNLVSLLLLGGIVFSLAKPYYIQGNDLKHVHEAIHTLQEDGKKLDQWKLEIIDRLGKIEGKLGIQ